MDRQVYEDMSALEGRHWWFVARRLYIEKLIETFFDVGKQLDFCEIGSGTGGNLELLSRFAETTAVEMDDSARQIILNKDLPNVAKVLGGHLPDNIEINRQFDGVFLLDVVEHIEDDLAALLRVKEFLKDDGILVTTVPAYQWLWSQHDVANHHRRRYILSDYQALIERAGYEINYSSYFNSILFPLAAVERLLSSLLARNEQKVDHGISMPPAFINAIFKALFKLEGICAGKLKIPFGLSIVVIASKRA